MGPDGNQCGACFSSDKDAEYVFMVNDSYVAGMPRKLSLGSGWLLLSMSSWAGRSKGTDPNP